jgi:hypothetical protein
MSEVDHRLTSGADVASSRRPKATEWQDAAANWPSVLLNATEWPLWFTGLNSDEATFLQQQGAERYGPKFKSIFVSDYESIWDRREDLMGGLDGMRQQMKLPGCPVPSLEPFPSELEDGYCSSSLQDRQSDAALLSDAEFSFS